MTMRGGAAQELGLDLPRQLTCCHWHWQRCQCQWQVQKKDLPEHGPAAATHTWELGSVSKTSVYEHCDAY
jgi:hypothetical protein